MSFAMVPANTTNEDGFSSPNRISFCVVDSGAGGDIYLNGQGVNDPTVAGAVDIATFFGVLYNSAILIAKAFGLSCASTAIASATLWPLLDISVTNQDAPHAPQPGFQWIVVGGAPNVPLLRILGPAVAGTWRVNIQLRHSIMF